jgi:putative hydrolase of the HAD superfamily
MLHTKPNHIFFDLDRTLWDYDQNLEDSLNELFDEHIGARVQAESDAFRRAFHFENTRLWKDFTENKIDKNFLREHRFHFTMQRLGIDDKPLALLVEDAYMEKTPAKKKLLPGVHEALGYLRMKYSLHIITNGFEDAQQFKLRNSGIHHYFTEIITSDSAGATKPNLEIYRHSELKTGASPEQCLMVGDDWHNDVHGALEAGWQALHYNPKAIDPQAITISNLSELITLL